MRGSRSHFSLSRLEDSTSEHTDFDEGLHRPEWAVGAIRLAFALLLLYGGICSLSSLGIPSSGSRADYNLATPHCRVLELRAFKLKALTRSAAFRMFSPVSK